MISSMYLSLEAAIKRSSGCNHLLNKTVKLFRVISCLHLALLRLSRVLVLVIRFLNL